MRALNSIGVLAGLSLLAGCGGGGAGAIASAPSPPTVPSPTPAPTPAPSPDPPRPAFQPISAQIFGEPLYNVELVVTGKGWQHEYVPNTAGARDVRDASTFTVRYDAATKSYLVNAPLTGSGTLMRIGEYNAYPFDPGFPAEPSNKSPTAYAGETLRFSAPGSAGSRYSYVSFADLYATTSAGSNLDSIVYGTFGVAQPTRAGEVPLSGTARYTGDLYGHFAGDAGATWIEGNSHFDFDFALGRLSGDVTISMKCMMGCAYDDVSYRLTDTQFARGSTSFSGALATPGAPASGSFSGLFAGPGAVEMLSQFQLPFFNPEFQRWMEAGGVIIGKRD